MSRFHLALVRAIPDGTHRVYHTTIWAGAQTVLRACRVAMSWRAAHARARVLSRDVTRERTWKSAGEKRARARSMVTACMQMNAFLYVASTMRRTPPRRTVKSENLLLLPPVLRVLSYALRSAQFRSLQFLDLRGFQRKFLGSLPSSFKLNSTFRCKREAIFYNFRETSRFSAR